MPDGSKEVLEAIAGLRIEMSTRIDALASELRAKDDKHTRVQARLEADLSSFKSTMSNDMLSFAARIESADGNSRKALKSVTELDTVKSAQQQEILNRLAKQDEDRDRFRESREAKERAEAESKRQESIAAKRLEERNRTVTERQKIWAPVIQVILLGAITSAATYGIQRSSRADTDAKLDAHARQLSAISEKVTSLSDSSVVLPLPFASANAAPAATAPAAPAATVPAAAAPASPPTSPSGPPSTGSQHPGSVKPR